MSGTELQTASRHRSAAHCLTYAKRTLNQLISSVPKRRVIRTNADKFLGIAA
jgi:hypothetical protein